MFGLLESFLTDNEATDHTVFRNYCKKMTLMAKNPTKKIRVGIGQSFNTLIKLKLLINFKVGLFD